MDITPLKHTVQNLQKKKHDLYRQYLNICNELDTQTNILKNTCKHINKEKKREDYLYGETYIYCNDCGLIL